MVNYLVLEIYGLNYKICFFKKNKIKFFKEFFASNDDEFVINIDNFKKENKILINTIIIILKEEKIYKRFKLYPKLNVKEVENLINNNINEYFPISVEEYVYDFEILDSSEKNIKVMIIAILEKLVKNYLNIIKKAGLNCIKIDFYQNAISRVVGKYFKEPTFVILNLFEKATIIYLKNGKINNIRDISLDYEIKYNIISAFDFYEQQISELKNVIFFDEIDILKNFFQNLGLNIFYLEDLKIKISEDVNFISFYGVNI